MQLSKLKLTDGSKSIERLEKEVELGINPSLYAVIDKIEVFIHPSMRL